MLTGYLLLGREYADGECLQRFLSRNLLGLVVAFEVWNVAWWAFLW